MYDRAYAVATGTFILVALAALITTAYWLTGRDFERRPYDVVSEYSVAGLAEGSQVLYRGVPAGRVDRIRINPDDAAQVLVRISVNPGIPVQHSTFARLHQRGLTGVAQVELQDTGEHQEPLITTEADPAKIRMLPGLLDEVTNAGTQALVRLTELADSLTAVLDEENRDRVTSILARVDSMIASVEKVSEALEADLPRTLDGASRAAESVAALADRTTQSMDEVDALIADLRETAAVARRLGEELSDSGVPGIDAALDAVNSAARELARLAQSIARQPERLLRGRQSTPGPGEE